MVWAQSLGGRATVGKATSVGPLAGVIEPASSQSCIGDNVLVGANAVVIEGVQVGNGSVVAAGLSLLKMFLKILVGLW